MSEKTRVFPTTTSGLQLAPSQLQELPVCSVLPRGMTLLGCEVSLQADGYDHLEIVFSADGASLEVEEALDSRKDFPRQFICYHRPAWGTGVKGDALDIQRSWSPLFEEYLVDAVFENDHHVYKRTHPLKGGRRDDENGVVYLGDGAWGGASPPAQF